MLQRAGRGDVNKRNQVLVRRKRVHEEGNKGCEGKEDERVRGLTEGVTVTKGRQSRE